MKEIRGIDVWGKMVGHIFSEMPIIQMSPINNIVAMILSIKLILFCLIIMTASVKTSNLCNEITSRQYGLTSTFLLVINEENDQERVIFVQQSAFKGVYLYNQSITLLV